MYKKAREGLSRSSDKVADTLIKTVCGLLLFFTFWPHPMASGILVPPTKDWTRIPCIRRQKTFNHWTTGEVPCLWTFNTCLGKGSTSLNSQVHSTEVLRSSPRRLGRFSFSPGFFRVSSHQLYVLTIVWHLEPDWVWGPQYPEDLQDSLLRKQFSSSPCWMLQFLKGNLTEILPVT